MKKEQRPGAQHPEEWRADLNPGSFREEQAGATITARDIKELHQRLNRLHADELERIPVLPVGTPLEQGSTYIDLAEEQPREFVATGQMVAGPDNFFVPKAEVDYLLWNRLIGVTQPERLGEAGD